MAENNWQLATVSYSIFTDTSLVELKIDESPDTESWKFVPLFKYDADEALLTWQIGFNGTHLVMLHGRVKGKPRETTTVVTTNNSGRSLAAQALLEARKRYKDKWHEGYQPAGETEAPVIDAMNAAIYTESTIKSWPVYVQPKLNGIRMLANVADGELYLRSRSNIRYEHLTHLAPTVMDLLSYLPRNCILDGELYNHDLSFNQIVSAVKTIKHKHPLLETLQYWLFDINYSDGTAATYENRYALLVRAYSQYLQDLTTTPIIGIVEAKVAYSHEEVVNFHNEYVELGYEGLMVKNLANTFAPGSAQYNLALYKPGRSKNILKYKQFCDEEVIVTGVKEAKGTEAGTAILEVKDIRGNTLTVRMRGSLERRRKWLLNPTLVIGKPLTIKYRELSPYGVPLFPVGVAIRDYE